MDWPNENYVRLYTRETDDDLVLSWEARAVWHEMLKRFDRSGLIELRRGRKGLAAVLRVPVEVVERGVPELIEDGRIRELEAGYFAPNFMEAQEATKSDRQRQKESRERRRSKHAVTDQDEPVTNRDESSRHAVTKRDANVTPPPQVVTLTSADPDPLPSSAELPAASEAPPPPAQIYPKTQIHNPRIKLNHDAWAYAALEHARLAGEGLTGSMAWSAIPGGAPQSDLVARTAELVEQANGDIAKAAAILRQRVDVAAAESKREGHLRWFTPSQLWDSKRFYRAIEIDPAEAAKPRFNPQAAPGAMPVRKARTL